MKGFTLIEIMTVMMIILFIWGSVSLLIRPQISSEIIRDQQRIADLKALELAVLMYLQQSSNIDLDGPSYTNSGKDEIAPRMFISIPYEDIDLRNATTNDAGVIWTITQTSKTIINRNDGVGWLPINFRSLIYPPIYTLPVDPSNNFSQKLFYTYVFNRANKTFEIDARLESKRYGKNGPEDQVSTDAGDNDNLLEVGSNRFLMTNGLY